MKFLDVLANTNREEGTQEIVYGGKGGGRKMATPIRRVSFEPQIVDHFGRIEWEVDRSVFYFCVSERVKLLIFSPRSGLASNVPPVADRVVSKPEIARLS